MKFQIWSYYDKEGDCYDVPFFSKDLLNAKRRFVLEVLHGDKTPVASFTDNFNLVQLGVFEVETGLITEPKGEKISIEGWKIKREVDAMKVRENNA